MEAEGGIDITNGASASSSLGTDFGNVVSDGSVFSTTSTFVVSNSGNSDLIVSSIVATNSDYDVGGTTSGTFDTSETFSFTVRVNPSSVGVNAANIVIDNNDSDEDPFTLPVTVNGIGT